MNIAPLWGSDSPPPDFPLEITAEKITCEQTKNTCAAVTNVKVVYDDPLNGRPKNYHYTLTSDHLRVDFEKTAANPTQGEKTSPSPMEGKKIHFIEANHHVVVIRTSKDDPKELPLIIHSDRATYDPKTDIIEFFGHVRIKDGNRAYSESTYASMNKKTGEYTISNASHQNKSISSKGQTKLILNMNTMNKA